MSTVEAVQEIRPAAALAGAPPLVDTLLQAPRAAFDLQRLVALVPVLRFAPEGDGHPVLVVPGFLVSDWTTKPMRVFLRWLGYPAYRWRLGRNVGPTEDAVTGLQWSLDRLTETHGQKATVIGWSLGGIIAREVGRINPDKVRQVISLGSPFGMEDPHLFMPVVRDSSGSRTT